MSDKRDVPRREAGLLILQRVSHWVAAEGTRKRSGQDVPPETLRRTLAAHVAGVITQFNDEQYTRKPFPATPAGVAGVAAVLVEKALALANAALKMHPAGLASVTDDRAQRTAELDDLLGKAAVFQEFEVDLPDGLAAGIVEARERVDHLTVRGLFEGWEARFPPQTVRLEPPREEGEPPTLVGEPVAAPETPSADRKRARRTIFQEGTKVSALGEYTALIRAVHKRLLTDLPETDRHTFEGLPRLTRGLLGLVLPDDVGPDIKQIRRATRGQKAD